MPFNSPEFIFLFLPLTLLLFASSLFFAPHQPRWPSLILLAASILFYSSWHPAYLPILLGSIGFNYWIGKALQDLPISDGPVLDGPVLDEPVLHASVRPKRLLALGIGVNLLLLGYFKYAHFFVSTLNAGVGTAFNLEKLALPLGISFFTFQQIAYLVDTYRQTAQQQSIDRPTIQTYASFVAFFPYLTAGPLLRYREMGPQLVGQSHGSPDESSADSPNDRSGQFNAQFNAQNLAIGITLFGLGLFKKMVLSETVAPYANQVFDVATQVPLTMTEAWVGALAFTLQLYFDFSGYSDMAIGVALMFGFQLPLNFSSPYKAASITRFWRQWHITLSNFLRDYLYIPLGGSRKGEPRRYLNLMLTMLIGGLWHGAGWTFVIWGGLHGLYLGLNHWWHHLRRSLGQRSDRTWNFTGWILTFVAVVVSWVFFRAETVAEALAMLQGMLGYNGLSLPEEWSDSLAFLPGIQFEGFMPHIDIQITALDDIEEPTSAQALRQTIVLLLFTWLMPNTQQWLARYYKPLYPDPSGVFWGQRMLGNRLGGLQTYLQTYFQTGFQTWQWQPNLFWAVVMGVVTVTALLNLATVSEFLYREF